MLSVAQLKDQAGRGAKSIAAYMAASEYYREAAGIGQGEWLGGGAKALGLDADSGDEPLANLLNGFRPDGRALVRNAGGADRTMGWDCCFSADKTMSVAYAAADTGKQREILAAHHRAVAAGLDYLGENLQSRTGAQGKGPAMAAGQGLIVRRVDHLDSREGDPQLHSHCVVVNASRGQDGRWRTMSGTDFFEAKHAAGAIYRHAMAREMQALGFGIDSVREQDADGRETGQVWHRVAGIDEPTRKAFSKRREQIVAAMAKGLDAGRATQRTRQGKGDENNPAIVVASARQALDEMRQANKIDWRTSADLIGKQGQAFGPIDPEKLLEGLHRTDSAWGKHHFVDAVAKNCALEHEPTKEAADLLARLQDRGLVRELEPDAQGRARFCSQAQWDLEAKIGDRALARKDETAHKIGADTVAKATAAHEKAQGFTLTDQQRGVVNFVAMETGGVACIQGQAGTGKTATAGAWLGAFRAAGYEVIGTSTAKKAADKLEAETGMTSVSCAKLLSDLDRGSLKLSDKSVVVVDEAGMVGAKTLGAIQEHADRAGSKLVLLGDPLQLQPVEAGSPFRMMVESQGSAAMTEIRRQKQDADKALAQAFYNGASGEQIVGDWQKRGQLQAGDKPREAVAMLVRDYLADQAPADDKLVIAATHADCAAINHGIRDGLKSQGRLKGEATVQVQGKIKGEKHDMAVAPGDRLLFKKNDNGLGVVNGQVCTVKKVEQDKDGAHTLTVGIAQEGGKERDLTFSTKQFDRLGYAYAGTTHAAQGQGAGQVYWLARPQGLDRNLGLVAFTRTKNTFKAYCADGDQAQIAGKLNEWGKKLGAQEMAPKVEQAQTTDADRITATLRDAMAKRLASSLPKHEITAPARPAQSPRLMPEHEWQAKEAVARDELEQVHDLAQARLATHMAKPGVAALMRQADKARNARDDAREALNGREGEPGLADKLKQAEKEQAKRQADIEKWREEHGLAKRWGDPPGLVAAWTSAVEQANEVRGLVEKAERKEAKAGATLAACVYQADAREARKLSAKVKTTGQDLADWNLAHDTEARAREKENERWMELGPDGQRREAEQDRKRAVDRGLGPPDLEEGARAAAREIMAARIRDQAREVATDRELLGRRAAVSSKGPPSLDEGVRAATKAALEAKKRQDALDRGEVPEQAQSLEREQGKAQGFRLAPPRPSRGLGIGR